MAEFTNREKFNREASAWDNNPQRRALTDAVAQAIIAKTLPEKTMRALEFGCGTGLVTQYLAPLVGTLSAIDTSSEMLAMLDQKIKTMQLSNIETACVDIFGSSESLIPERSFDLIYSSMTLHHVADTAACLRRLAKLLVPRGTLALADLDLEDGQFHDDSLEQVHHGFDRTELATLLEKAGFEAITFETIYTLEKPNSQGATTSYPVFLVVAVKSF